MIRTLFDNHVFIYILLALTGCGILMKLVVQVLYTRLLKASETMSTSKNKLAKNMKKKFEAYYKLKLGVNNVDIFVDKHFFHYKFCGIFLSTWETLCGQVLVLSLLVGAISTILGLIYECGKNQILTTFTVGILSCGLLIFFEGVVNPTGKKEMIRLNMKDYLENVLKVRLVQEESQPELMEQYKKAYQPSSYTAVSKEQQERDKLRPFQKRKKNKSREAKRLEKLNQKARQKDEAAKRQENKKLSKINKKAESQKQRTIEKEAKQNERMERELNARKQKEAKKQEAARLKAEALEIEQKKKEEKQQQKELKRVLKLEKKHRGYSARTTAQEKKENLLKEIQNRRDMESKTAETVGQAENEQESVNASSTHFSGRKADNSKGVTESKAESSHANHSGKERVEHMPAKEGEPKKAEETKSYKKEEVKEVKVQEETGKEIKTVEANTAEVKVAEVSTAKVRDIKTKPAAAKSVAVKPVSIKPVTAKQDITYHDDRTAAALEDGRGYNYKEYEIVKPTSEEEEKIIEDILKDIFA